MRRLSSALVVIASLSLAACGPAETTDPNTDPGTDPVVSPYACGSDHTEITADQLFTDVVQARCASCHFANNPNGTTLVLDSAEALRAAVGAASTYGGTIKIVEANHSENSTMYLKSIGGSVAGVKAPGDKSVGGPMPQTGQLSDAEKLKIQDWICTGAK